MGINLECEQVELWQMPTHIAWMCYSNRDGGWKGILYRYTQWIRGTTTGVWKKESDYYEQMEAVLSHMKELEAAVTANGRLDFSIG